MIRECPKCRTPQLRPLSAYRSAPDPSGVPPPSICASCRGVWLPHEAIREELVPEQVHLTDEQTPITADSDSRAGFCPTGHGIMRRAKFERNGPPFFVDRCEACRGVWFDAGEWAVIAGSQWLRHLDDLWDPVFRKKLREKKEREHHFDTLKQALGDDVFGKVIAAAEGLRGHPMRSVALAFLLEETGSHAEDEKS